MRMIILGGFLGSGKTSFLLHIAGHIAGKQPDNPAKVVILENEIGEVSVDDKLLQSERYKVETMFSGCVCCTMSGELIVNISVIMRDFNPDWILMEATGVAYPSSIKENITESLGVDCTVCCIVDAKRWNRLLLPMKTLLVDQLKGADFILINKIDMVEEEVLAQVNRSVYTFNDSAIYYHISAAKEIDGRVLEEILK